MSNEIYSLEKESDVEILRDHGRRRNRPEEAVDSPEGVARPTSGLPASSRLGVTRKN